MIHSNHTHMADGAHAASAAGEDIACSVYSSFEDITDLQKEWDGLVASVGGEIFLTFDWCRIWWKFYGHRRALHIYVFRRNCDIVGILPLFIESLWLGPVPVRVAKIVGSDFTLAQFTLAVKSECLPEVIRAFMKIAEGHQWDLCSLGPISGFSHGREDLELLFRHTDDTRHYIQVDEIGVQTVFELPDAWDDYLALLNKKERQLMRSNYRKIQASSLQVQCRVATAEDFAEEFDAFVATHQGQWKRSGQAGHFGDWPRSLDFHRDVAEAQLQHDRLRLLRVRVSAECTAYQYSYQLGRRYFEMLMGRSSCDASHAVDLGRLLFAEQTQRAMQQGVRSIDSMRGRYDYKLRLGGKLFPLLRVRIVRKGACRAVRLACFGACASLIDLVYYKLWYCRIAPKLPLPSGPLWSGWIRSNGLRAARTPGRL